MKPINIIRTALFAIILYLSQVALSPLPNIEIVSLLIVIFALKYKHEATFATLIYTSITVLQWGFGIWSIGYYIAWPMLSLIAIVFKNKIGDNWIVWSTLLGLYGLLFGTITALPMLPVLGFKPTLAYILAGLSFDILHCLGNFFISIVLGKTIYNRLKEIEKYVV